MYAAVEAARKPMSRGGSFPRRSAPKFFPRRGNSSAAQGRVCAHMTREMGKVLAETRGDVQEAIDMTYLMAGEGRRLFGQTTPSELPNKFAMSVRAPVGVAALITPWNFPMAIPSWKESRRLFAETRSSLSRPKIRRSLPTTMCKVLEEAGIPRGVITWCSVTARYGGADTEHPDVNMVIFTGSTEVGRIVGAARRASKSAIWKWAARTSSS